MQDKRVMDMSSTYALVCNNLIPCATQIIDKFHVMKHVYEVVSNVRIGIRKTLLAMLTKGTKKRKKIKKS